MYLGSAKDQNFFVGDGDYYTLQGNDRLIQDGNTAFLAGGLGDDSYEISGSAIATIFDSGGTDQILFESPSQNGSFDDSYDFIEVDGLHLLVVDSSGQGFSVLDWELSSSRIETWTINGENYSYDQWHSYVESHRNYRETTSDELFGNAEEAQEWRSTIDTAKHLDLSYQGIIEKDRLEGTSENDSFLGTNASDQLYGREGNDYIKGGQGFDYVQGNQGDDNVNGGDEDDTVRGGKDQDWVAGDNGDDLVMGDKGHDTVYGGSGVDFVRGGQGNDLIFGESGSDTVMGDLGNDTLVGGSNGDLFIFRNGDGQDIIRDFKGNSNEQIHLRDGGSYSVNTSGDFVIISYGDDDQITLEGVTKFDADWII